MPFPIIPLAIAAGSLLAGAIMKPRDPKLVAADVSSPAIAEAYESTRLSESQIAGTQKRLFGDMNAAGLTGSSAAPALESLFSSSNVFRSKINATIMDTITRAETAQNIENARIQNQIETIRASQDEVRRKAIFGGAANIASIFAGAGMGNIGSTKLEIDTQINEGIGNYILDQQDIADDSYLDSL